MSMSSSRIGAALVAGALLLGSAPGFRAAAGARRPAGQPAAPAGADESRSASRRRITGPRFAVTDQAANKDICYTTRDFGAQKDQPPVLALAVYDVKGEDTKIVRFLMPVGLMLRPGFRFAVDKGPVSEGAFEICFPNGCFAEAKVKKDIIEAAKKGTTMSVVVKNQANAEVVFNLPLAGFGKAFDGPAIDPKVLEEQQKKLAAELQKRAEEERKKLEAQQPGGAAPVPPRPARSKGLPAASEDAGRRRNFARGFPRVSFGLTARKFRARLSSPIRIQFRIGIEFADFRYSAGSRARRPRRSADCAAARRCRRVQDSARTHRRYIRFRNFPHRGGRRAGPWRAALLREWTATIPRYWRKPDRRRKSRREKDICGV